MADVSAGRETTGRPRFLLSASVPTDDARGRAFAPASSRDVTAAASAVAREVLHRGAVLVFGGHPSISPMVLLAAAELDVQHQVVIFQSRYFWEDITPEVHRLVSEDYGLLVDVDAIPSATDSRGDRKASLARMRARMLSEPLAGAFFVGGMEGISEEAQEFRRQHPSRPAFFFVTPGGNAAKLARDASHRIVWQPDLILNSYDELGPGDYSVEGRAYQALAAHLVAGV